MHTTARRRAPHGLDDLRSVLAARGPAPLAFRLHDGNGAAVVIGEGEPVLDVGITAPAGYAALASGSELAVVEAYLRGEIDLDGDLARAMELRTLLRDDRPLTHAWAVLEPALRGRVRSNPDAIARHYDSGNIQLHATDSVWHTYTPGIYADPDESMEVGAERKLDAAFRSLRLAPGATLLDVGCGWGGFLRFCAARGVAATGITLSRDQLAHARAALAADGLDAEAHYADFFTYRPPRRFAAISMMGVLEDLSDYRLVMRRLRELVEPGGRVHLDFAAAGRRFQVSGFVTRYIWPGAFRMVYMPQFVRAADAAGFEIVSIENDRHNYHLWGRKLYETWAANRAEVLAEADERTYRLMRILFAGTSWVMSPVSARATAYRVVLRARPDGAALGALTAATARRRFARVGDAVPHLLRRML